MKYIIPSLSLITLASASAVAQTAPTAKGQGLSYDRVAVGYAKTDLNTSQLSGSLQGLSGMFTALLGDTLIVGGSYSDLEGKKDFSAFSGNGNSFLIGAKFSVGPGDLIVSYTYSLAQLTGSGFVYDGNDEYFGGLGLQNESDTFSLGYRFAVNSAFEVSAFISNTSGETSYLAYAVGTSIGVAGDLYYEADTLDVSETSFALGARYNITKELDLSVNYSFADENTLSLSVGYNF